jgi:hypothetical protein
LGSSSVVEIDRGAVAIFEFIDSCIEENNPCILHLTEENILELLSKVFLSP